MEVNGKIIEEYGFEAAEKRFFLEWKSLISVLYKENTIPLDEAAAIAYHQLLFNKLNSNSMTTKNSKRYWKENLKYLAILLSIWFVVSFGFGIIWVNELNVIRLGGFKLGFWFAQQGSIYVFVLLIFVYIRLMNKLDKKYNFNKE